MDLKPYSNTELHGLRTINMSERDNRMVQRIVSQVHSFVVSRAKDGKLEYTWNSNSYPFDNFQEYKIYHIVFACQKLRELFPEAIITRPRQKEIHIEWY